MLLSIISPVYNVKEYLNEFVTSLVNQQVTDYELILVDDGSTDGSSQLCDRLGEKYKNIRVVHKKNGGVSAARNDGARIAKGKYIFFVDSDDVFSHNVLYELFDFIEKNKNTEAFVLPLNRFDEKGLKTLSYAKYNNCTDLIHLCDEMVNDGIMPPWNICSLIYKTEYFKVNCLKLNAYYTSAEDLDLFLKNVNLKPKIKVFAKAVINYRVGRKGSADNTINYQNVLSQLKVYKKAYETFLDDNLMRVYFAKRFTNIIVQIAQISLTEQKEMCYKFVCQNYEIVTKAKGTKYLFARIVWRCFGLRLGTKIIQTVRSSINYVDYR